MKVEILDALVLVMMFEISKIHSKNGKICKWCYANSN